MTITSDIQKYLENISRFGYSEFWYLASPYTGLDKSVELVRVDQMREITRLLATRPGVIPFCPIVYTSDLEKDWSDEPALGWYCFCLEFLAKADKLVVVELEGWQESFGVQIEIAYALGRGLPIEYYDLDSETGKFVKVLGVDSEIELLSDENSE